MVCSVILRLSRSYVLLNRTLRNAVLLCRVLRRWTELVTTIVYTQIIRRVIDRVSPWKSLLIADRETSFVSVEKDLRFVLKNNLFV
jgi:hypothetical protein